MLDIALLVCDKPGAYAIERAKVAKFRVLFLTQKTMLVKKTYEKDILSELNKILWCRIHCPCWLYAVNWINLVRRISRAGL